MTSDIGLVFFDTACKRTRLYPNHENCINSSTTGTTRTVDNFCHLTKNLRPISKKSHSRCKCLVRPLGQHLGLHRTAGLVPTVKHILQMSDVLPWRLFWMKMRKC